MKLLDYILLSLAAVFLIIGIDQTMKRYDGYWAFMLAVVSLIFLNYRKFLKEKEKKKS